LKLEYGSPPKFITLNIQESPSENIVQKAKLVIDGNKIDPNLKADITEVLQAE